MQRYPVSLLDLFKISAELWLCCTDILKRKETFSMLRDFLETNIQNKLNIFFMLSAHESVSVREVSETLNISPSNVLFLLDELMSDLSENAVIKKVNTKYSIDSNTFSYSVLQLLNIETLCSPVLGA